MKKILSVLFLFWFLFVNFSLASDDIKYASTRMKWCTDYDIVINNQVWAACNSNYEINNKTEHPEIELDMNGRSVWNYYGSHYDDVENNSVACPNGYIVPTYSDFLKAIPNETSPNIAKLKLSAGGLYSSYSKHVSSFDTHGYYWIRALQKKLFVLSVWSDVYDSYDNNWKLYSLRCMRVAPATQEEKIWNRSLVNQSKTWDYGIAPSGNFGISNNLDFSVASGSKDEYVNAKLNEINECFLDTYSWHLNTIISAWQKLLQQKSAAKTPLEIKKYEKALSKINEIKVLFEKRYKFLFNYSNKKTTGNTGTNSSLSGKLFK